MKHFPILALMSVTFGVALSTSCSTTRGFGQDLQKVGSRLENRAAATGGAEPDRPAATTAPSTGPVTPSAY